MFFRAKRALNRAWFDLRCRRILQTPPIIPSDPSVTVLSMLCHGEVTMYLLAVKSFLHALGFSPNVVVLNDGTLDVDDERTLEKHLPGIRIARIDAISTGPCPRGGCWERLMLVTELCQHSYVIQLDSDTLTRGAIPEVLACIAQNRSFTLLGDRSYPQVEPMLDACARLQGTNSMVQAVCERAFDKLPEAVNLKYLRGNAGFVGYARGSITRERVEWFSELMRRIAEGTWDTWGSEQLTSNLLIANSDDPLPLPVPQYLSYWEHPDIDYRQSVFLHFIGPHRFAAGFYIRSAREVIAALGRSHDRGQG